MTIRCWPQDELKLGKCSLRRLEMSFLHVLIAAIPVTLCRDVLYNRLNSERKDQCSVLSVRDLSPVPCIIDYETNQDSKE
jgi:hypothetical protein